MKWLVIAVALAGCQQVFGIRKVPDAAETDIDGPIDCPPGIGHDDDGDCIGDGSDDCPGIADVAQVDQDSDKIGDACDPDPSAAGNQLVVFVPFDVGSEQVLWSTLGAWTIGDDAFSNADMTNNVEDWAYRMGDKYGPGDELEARITVGDFAMGNDVKIGLGFYVPMSGTSVGAEWSCSVHLAPGTKPATDSFNNGVAGSRPLLPDDKFGPGATYTMKMRLDTGLVTCDIRGDGGDVGTTTAMNTNPPLPDGFLALYTQGATAHVQSVAVYTAK